MNKTVSLTGHASAEQALTYLHLPFDVPAQTRWIVVRYRYSDPIGSDPWLTGGNTVDLGLVDARGAAFCEMGLRGWSGSARSEVFVGEQAATPGYASGALDAGTWHVILGLYKIAPQGCDYTVEITLSNEAGLPPAHHGAAMLPAAARLSLDAPASHAPTHAGGWYRGELHCHSQHSDGEASVEDIILAALALNLDFLAITDHNDLTHHARMAAYVAANHPPITLIPGCEMTTYHGHWNAWGIDDWVEFRIVTEMQMQLAMREARRRGAIVSCNHPRTYGPPWEFAGVTDFDCLEVWNGPWMLNNWEALDVWEQLLRQGRRITAVGGSDMHRLHQIDGTVARLAHPITWIHTPDAPSPRALLNALKAGHCALSEAPDGPRVFLQAGGAQSGDAIERRIDTCAVVTVAGGAGLQCVVRGAAGERFCAAVTHEMQTFTLHLDCSDEMFLWAQLRSPDALGGQPVIHAMTNPIYMHQK